MSDENEEKAKNSHCFSTIQLGRIVGGRMLGSVLEQVAGKLKWEIDENELTNKDDFAQIIDRMKISPPGKVFTKDKLTQDAELAIHDILSLQEIIGTNAIPALLLAISTAMI